MKKNETWHFDGVGRFGKRTIDDVKILDAVESRQKTVLVYSPHERANILVYKKELLYKI